ncbi:MAG: hypothetical protein HOC74_36500 [Gemmatimonadetes bacterium]|jgi:hypothetical protein|nr:hypothetical protein [Gemmatimonadota bacterium]
MRTFSKVIGASAGMVVCLFLIAAGILYWSAEKGMAPPMGLADVDSTQVVQQSASEPEELTKIGRPSTAKNENLTERPALVRPVADDGVPAMTAVTSTSLEEKEESSPSMTNEEFLAREVHYIEKIQKDAEAVLTRAGEERAKTAALEAELEALLIQ